MTRTAHAAQADAASLGDLFVRPMLMGVVNATPDSFFEGSRAASTDAIVERALKLVEDGAGILDIGGQSTRPGSEPVPADEERARVIPAIKALAKRIKIPISVDTDKGAIADEAFDAGATILNDVSALRGEGMMKAALRFDKVILMHMSGEPRTMQKDPRYDDVVDDVKLFLDARHTRFRAEGGRAERIWIDPGIGFGKSLEHNLALIRALPSLARTAPVVLGVSRKSMFAKITPDGGPQDRLAGSLAVAAWAALSGACAVLRVHDVLETKRTLDVLAALAGGKA
jgi:dihydropteroate synthase